MPTPTIIKAEEQFFNVIYEGNGGGQRVGNFVPFTDNGTIAKSCIFEDGDSAVLSKTFSGDGNRKKFTISVWFKRGNLGSAYFITSTGANSSNRLQISIESSNKLNVEAKTSGSTQLHLQTNRTFEDTSKWYHLLLAVDTTDSTSGNRGKLYIDGDRVTSFANETYPSQDADLQWNAAQEHLIGKRTYASTYYDGYLAEFNNVDGQALLPASFGTTNTSTGRWIPSVVKPYPTTTTTYTVTVVGGNPSNHPYHNVGSSNKYAIDGSTATADVTLTLIEGATYKFDQSDSSNSGHPLRFSTTANGTHGGGSEYTTGVTTVGTPGSSGAYTEITVAVGAPTLYYYCTNHSAMGWTANTQDQYGTNGFRLQFLDSTHAGIDTSGNSNNFTATNFIDFTSQPIYMGGTAFDTGSAGAWDGSYPVANGFTESTSTQAIYNDGSTAVGGVIGWDFGSGKSANIQTIKINQLAVNNSITGFTFEYSDNGSDYTSVGTFSVTASTSTQTVSVLNTAGKHRYWRLKSTTDTSGGQSSYRWVVAFLGFFSEPVTTDSPSQNFPTFDSNQTIDNAGGTNVFSQGNLRVDMDYGGSSNQYGMAIMNPAFGVTSGKYYWEHKLISQSHSNPSIYNLSMPGIIDLNRDADLTSYIGHTSGKTTYSWYTLGGYVFVNGTYDPTQFLPGGSTLPAIGDTINFALDMDNGAWYIGVNGTYVTAFGAVGDPTSGSSRTGAVIKFAPGTRKYVYGTSTQSGFNCVDEVNFGQRSFKNSIPTGYTKWTQDNVPTTDRDIPDFVWVKNRDQGSNSHGLIDSSRGASKNVFSNATSAEQDYDERGLIKFLKGGYSCGEYQYINGSGDRLVSWNWRANGATTASNSDGSINSTVQANTTAGFSIIQYTGTGSAGTIGHGLSSTPEWILIKELTNSDSWNVWHTSLANTEKLLLNDTGAKITGSTVWNSTSPTSSVISINGNNVNASSENYIAYVWHGIPGFSKFGKYEGNNRYPNGRFVYLGFKARWIMVKRIDSAGYDWQIWDTKRSPINPSTNQALFPNSTAVEGGTSELDINSNGFKFRSNGAWLNAYGTYIYMAFAEYPLLGDGTNPATAR